MNKKLDFKRGATHTHLFHFTFFTTRTKMESHYIRLNNGKRKKEREMEREGIRPEFSEHEGNLIIIKNLLPMFCVDPFLLPPMFLGSRVNAFLPLSTPSHPLKCDSIRINKSVEPAILPSSIFSSPDLRFQHWERFLYRNVSSNPVPLQVWLMSVSPHLSREFTVLSLPSRFRSSNRIFLRSKEER